jgi:hypothetical protein
MNNHKKKIDKFRELNTLMDYFLNPHFDQVATKDQKKTVQDYFAKEEDSITDES